MNLTSMNLAPDILAILCRERNVTVPLILELCESSSPVSRPENTCYETGII